ncbi:MAG TPA: DUF5671 domain-containing protein [Actinomycetota bacterium]|nr:DUF5671 domain-containing protein [Actinomycetota bacterium]
MIFAALGTLAVLSVIASVVSVVVIIVRWAVLRRKHEVGLSGPRDAFLYLLSTACLYATVIGAMILVFGLADIWFPEEGRTSGFSGPVRAGIAIAIVTAPLFFILNSIIASRLRKGDMDPHSTLRRGLTYLTLLLIVATALGDLMFVINALLGGEMTAVTVVRTAGVLVIAAAVYLYHSSIVREDALWK